MNGSIEQIEQVLLSELAPLDEQAERLQGELQAVDEKRRRLTAAIEALSTGGKKFRSSKRTKPCSTKAEVIQILSQLLSDNGSLALDDLEGLAKDRLANELGKSLSGFGLRMKEALSDSRFVRRSDGHYGLSTPSTAV